jgi:hypothetical protein
MHLLDLKTAVLSSNNYSEFDKSLKPLLLETYQGLYNKELCRTCQSSYLEAYRYLKRDFINEDMATTKKTDPVGPEIKFKDEFKGNAVHIAGVSFPITEENITQEIAEQFAEELKDIIEISK